MRAIEVAEGDIEEVITTIFDDYLFDVDGAERVVLLEEQISSAEEHDLDVVSKMVTWGLRSAIDSYFPLRWIIYTQAQSTIY